MRHALKSKTPSSVARNSYISRTGKYRALDGKRDDLVIYDFGNMPAFAQKDPELFWLAADEYERKNARLCLELELNLPRELKPNQQVEVVELYLKQLEGKAGKFPFSYAIHCDEHGKNPHVHLMLSERALDDLERPSSLFFRRANKKNPELGGVVKSRFWHDKENVFWSRAAWADSCNQILLKNGHTPRFDPRSKKAQKEEALKSGDLRKAALLSTLTEKHEGWFVSGVAKRLKAKKIKPQDVPEDALITITENLFIRAYNGDLRDWVKLASDDELKAFLSSKDPVQFIADQYKQPTLQSIKVDQERLQRDVDACVNQLEAVTGSIGTLQKDNLRKAEELERSLKKAQEAKTRASEMAASGLKKAFVFLGFVKDRSLHWHQQYDSWKKQSELDKKILDLNQKKLTELTSEKRVLEEKQQKLNALQKRLSTLSLTVMPRNERINLLATSWEKLDLLRREVNTIETEQIRKLDQYLIGVLNDQILLWEENTSPEAHFEAIKLNAELLVKVRKVQAVESKIALDMAAEKVKNKELLAMAIEKNKLKMQETWQIVDSLSPENGVFLTDAAYDAWEHVEWSAIYLGDLEKRLQSLIYLDDSIQDELAETYLDLEKRLDWLRSELTESQILHAFPDDHASADESTASHKFCL